jgi:hypothetical protein
MVGHDGKIPSYYWNRSGGQSDRRSYELGKYEVNQGQWIKIMGSNPSKFKGDERRPVDSIGRESADAS